MSDEVRIEYTPPPTVARFMDSNARVRIIKGPVGSGKTSGCVMDLLTRAMAQTRGPDGLRRTRWAVIRGTYRKLEDTTRKTFQQWIPAPHLGRWRESDFAFDMNFNDVRAEVLFRALDRPEHVGNVLSLDLTGVYVNEFRELPQVLFNALRGRTGRYPKKEDGGASWRGLFGDTNPWHASHWAAKVFKKAPPDFELFVQPGGRTPQAENLDNLPRCWDRSVSDAQDGGDRRAVAEARREQKQRLAADQHERVCCCYYQDLCIGADREWIKVYVDGEDAASVVGSIYGELLEALEKSGGVGEFEHSPNEVFTSWDLGRSDATSIWFWRIAGRGHVEVIDHYENHLKPLSHYFDVIDGRGYEYVKHWLPHDAAAKTLASEMSVEDQCRARWPGKVEIGPSLSVADGIAAARWLLEGRVRFHERCGEGIDALRAYRRKWDEQSRAFSNEPMHDWSSHCADAFRYMAVVVKVSEMITRKPLPKPRVVIVRQPTLDEIFREHDAESDKPERF